MVSLAVNTDVLQTQSLIITPELRQSINILQLSSVDLLKFLEEKALENPAIVIDDEAQYMPYKKSSRINQNTEYNNWIDTVPRNNETLESFLLEQLMYQKINAQTRKIAEYIIGNISPSGYLEISTDEIAYTLNTSMEEVEKSLDLIQSFEPEGVGARNLRECLLLQLQRFNNPIHPLAEPIIQSYLSEIADGKIRQVAKALGAQPGDVQLAIDEIRINLHPKPGVAFEVDELLFVIPDVFVRRIGGEYKLLLNDSLFPKVTIQKEYTQSIVSESIKDAGFNEYIQEHVQSALWIKRSVDKRKKTIFRVSEAIMSHQASFLENAVPHIRPLQLKDIAAELNMHESTVSRTTQGKYIQTPHGVFELKYFFSNGLSQGTDSTVSSHSVKKRIAYEIDRENPSNPISDAQICELLNDDQIEISRRTVAKYRKELRIPASSKRKRFY